MTSFAITPTKSAITLFSEDGLTLSNDHIAILLVLICAWKMYLVDACFYMNDIHVNKYITEIAYWPIFIKHRFWKITYSYTSGIDLCLENVCSWCLFLYEWYSCKKIYHRTCLLTSFYQKRILENCANIYYSHCQYNRLDNNKAYIAMFAHSGVQHILCCVFILFSSSLCILSCQFLSSVFSNVHTIYGMIFSMIVLAFGRHLHDRIMSIRRKF